MTGKDVLIEYANEALNEIEKDKYEHTKTGMLVQLAKTDAGGFHENVDVDSFDRVELINYIGAHAAALAYWNPDDVQPVQVRGKFEVKTADGINFEVYSDTDSTAINVYRFNAYDSKLHNEKLIGTELAKDYPLHIRDIRDVGLMNAVLQTIADGADGEFYASTLIQNMRTIGFKKYGRGAMLNALWRFANFGDVAVEYKSIVEHYASTATYCVWLDLCESALMFACKGQDMEATLNERIPGYTAWVVNGAAIKMYKEQAVVCYAVYDVEREELVDKYDPQTDVTECMLPSHVDYDMVRKAGLNHAVSIQMISENKGEQITCQVVDTDKESVKTCHFCNVNSTSVECKKMVTFDDTSTREKLYICDKCVGKLKRALKTLEGSNAL